MGFEASANVQLMKDLGLRASVDYVNAEQTKDTVQPLPFIPPMHGLLRLAYQDIIYGAMIEWRLAANQERLAAGETPTAGYGILNIGAGVRLLQGARSCIISVCAATIFSIKCTVIIPPSLKTFFHSQGGECGSIMI